jgi:FkbM family methyltransferase
MVSLGRFILWFLSIDGEIIEVRFTVKGRSFSARVPSDSIWSAVKDVLLNREYEHLPGFELCNFKGTIVDAGAHVGLFSLVASVFAEKVIAIEPHQMNNNMLLMNILNNSVGNVIPMNKALFSHKTKLKLFQGSTSVTPSLIGNSGNFEYVETTTLEEIVDSQGPIDFLKMDIEGAEFDVFNHVDFKTLKQIGMIACEVHPRYGDINSIVEKLRSAGFQVKVVHPPILKRRNFNYDIKLHGMLKLKMLRGLLYAPLKVIKYENRDLAVLFASLEERLT